MGSSRCLEVVGEQAAQGGGAAGGVALDRAAADAERVGDLGLGQVDVVAQREHLALAAGEGLPARRARRPAGRSRARPRPRRVRRPVRGWRSACARTTLRWRSADRERLTTAWRR